MSNPLIMLAGLPGTGKTTNAKLLEERLGYERFDPLRTRRELGFEHWSADQRPAVSEYTNRRIRELYEEGRGAIVEGSYGLLTSREDIYSVAKELDLDVLTFQHECPREVSLHRMQGRAKPGPVPESTDPAIYDEIKDTWQPIEDDLEANPFLSLTRYDTLNNLFTDVRVNNPVYLSLVKDILLSK